MNELSHEELVKRISELEEKIHRLESDLAHDNLTSLKNRGYFEKKSKDHLESAKKIKRGERREWSGFKDISFLFFDIDHFKKINDTYGHDIGDKVLKIVAETLKSSLRVGDIVARWGGEEFIAILLGSGEKDSKVKAEEIREKVEKLEFDEPKDLKVTLSIGVAEFDEDKTFEDLVKHSDTALYHAKNSGRNKVMAHSEIQR